MSLTKPMGRISLAIIPQAAQVSSLALSEDGSKGDTNFLAKLSIVGGAENQVSFDDFLCRIHHKLMLPLYSDHK